MDGRGFFLGLIAAVVLFLLWKKESGPSMSFSFPGVSPTAGGTGTGTGCAGCAGGAGCPGCGSSPSYTNPAPTGGPSYVAAPAVQAAMIAAGSSGQITPGTPPLQSVVGSGSFYATSGPTPDNSFTNVPGKPVSVAPTVVRTQTQVQNVPGSPSTPATIVPSRAVAVVAPYSVAGFVQRYNVAGVPRTALRNSILAAKVGVN